MLGTFSFGWCFTWEQFQIFRKAVEGSRIYYIQFRLLLLSSIMRAHFQKWEAALIRSCWISPVLPWRSFYVPGSHSGSLTVLSHRVSLASAGLWPLLRFSLFSWPWQFQRGMVGCFTECPQSWASLSADLFSHPDYSPRHRDSGAGAM